MKITLLAAVAASLFSGTSNAADASAKTTVRIAVFDYSAVAFSGSIEVGDTSYRFSDRDAQERVSRGDMRIREVLVPVNREVILATAGSEWPIRICLVVPATEYSQCLPTNKADVMNSAMTFGFGPEGWSR